MDSKKPKPSTEVPLSESTISPSLSAIRERCSELFDTGGFINFEIVDGENDPDALEAGAYDPYDRKKSAVKKKHSA
ncbi:MAG: hypothetical protein HKP32_11105 [Woeseia sp.]|nr:hypothetical protein [Woeseia sp.]MBT8096936.1 hypothetical protein [Woeseia sp.]NNL55691.1 hypothetical protein [Woeseia sp.]